MPKPMKKIIGHLSNRMAMRYMLNNKLFVRSRLYQREAKCRKPLIQESAPAPVHRRHVERRAHPMSAVVGKHQPYSGKEPG
jgi:hypothetical protein